MICQHARRHSRPCAPANANINASLESCPSSRAAWPALASKPVVTTLLQCGKAAQARCQLRRPSAEREVDQDDGRSAPSVYSA